MATAVPDTARLFFAAWPRPDVQRRLHEVALECRRDCGGRAVLEQNIHLTLAFLGNVERAGLPGIEACAAATSGSACKLTIGRLGYWRHNRILWAGTESCPPAFPALASALASGLRAL